MEEQTPIQEGQCSHVNCSCKVVIHKDQGRLRLGSCPTCSHHEITEMSCPTDQSKLPIQESWEEGNKQMQNLQQGTSLNGVFTVPSLQPKLGRLSSQQCPDGQQATGRNDTAPNTDIDTDEDSHEQNLDADCEKTSWFGCFGTFYAYAWEVLNRLENRVLKVEQQLLDINNCVHIWSISDISKQRKIAIDGKIAPLSSQPFYTSKNGYKACIKVYLNGDGIGHETHLSVCFVLMKGEFDALLKWPFDHKVSLILVDQSRRKHLYCTFKPTPESSSFQQPISDMNASYCLPQFCKLSYLDNVNYTKDDVLFIKCVVDTSTYCSHPEY